MIQEFCIKLLETGSVWEGARSGVLGGAEALAFEYVGGQFGANPVGSDLVERSVVEGIVGGAFSSAGGGRFSDGFLGAFVASESSGLIGEIGGSPNEAAYYSASNEASRVAISAMVGGTVSQLTGGNFTDGAVAGAFQRLFNDENEKNIEDGLPTSKEDDLVFTNQATSSGLQRMFQSMGLPPIPPDQVTENDIAFYQGLTITGINASQQMNIIEGLFNSFSPYSNPTSFTAVGLDLLKGGIEWGSREYNFNDLQNAKIYSAVLNVLVNNYGDLYRGRVIGGDYGGYNFLRP